MKKLTKTVTGPLGRLSLVALVLMTLTLWRTPVAHAEMMLLASTSLVSGSSAATYSFDAPSAGTVTAQISTMPWPVPLSALSFSATTATDTLASWSMTDSTVPSVETFQVGSGTYFAHVNATAGGDLDLGLYSLMLTFTPSAVPLPAAAGMLVIGMFVLFALRRTIREAGPRNESVMYPA